MPDPAAPIPYRTKSQIVVDALRTRVVEGVLQPGDRVVLRPLADEFGCSEIPVREAVLSLAAEGLLEMVPHGGARVTRLNGAAIVELTEVRGLLEPRATRLAGESMTPAGLARLKEFLKSMKTLVDQGSLEGYGTLNREFHRCFLEFCPNGRLVGTINDLWDQSERARAVYVTLPGHAVVSLRQHTAMVKAMEERRFDNLEAIAAEHAQHGLSAVRRLAVHLNDQDMAMTGNLAR